MHPIFLSVLTSLLLTLGSCGAGLALSGRLEADKGEFRLTLDDGRTLTGDDLVGARIVVQTGERSLHVLVEGIETDGAAPGGPVTLYRLLVADPAGGPLQNACLPDTRGRQLGLPVPKDTGFGFTCTGGAEGKCILMGYRPWQSSPDVPMRDLHAACVHMMRADYGGDDRPTTRDGTQINIYDRFGIQEASVAPAMTFEAAWGPDGAVCVAHPRIAEHVSLAQLAERYPALKGLLGPDACTEEAMRLHPGALILNASVPPNPEPTPPR